MESEKTATAVAGTRWIARLKKGESAPVPDSMRGEAMRANVRLTLAQRFHLVADVRGDRVVLTRV
jgi:hypothetical protein